MSENVKERWFKIGNVNDFEYNKMKIVKIENLEIGVLKISNGDFRIIKNSCPHKMGPICKGTISGTFLPSEPGEFRYGFEGRILRCPWHRYEFDLETGQIIFSDLKLKLKFYPYKIENNEIFILL